MKRTLTLTMTALALTTSVAAQETMVAYPVLQAPLEKQRIEARAAVESRITTGAPYSAEAVNESLQVLSDGNRIARKTTTRVYRDSEGRTRREQVTSTGTLTTPPPMPSSVDRLPARNDAIRLSGTRRTAYVVVCPVCSSVKRPPRRPTAAWGGSGGAEASAR